MAAPLDFAMKTPDEDEIEDYSARGLVFMRRHASSDELVEFVGVRPGRPDTIDVGERNALISASRRFKSNLPRLASARPTRHTSRGIEVPCRPRVLDFVLIFAKSYEKGDVICLKGAWWTNSMFKVLLKATNVHGMETSTASLLELLWPL
jgi:hypothetical protein